MKIICSTNMPLVKEAFSTIGEATILEGRTITADDLKDADIFATRSTTKVNEALLAGSKVKFVGTATIGIDHMDTDYMESNNIKWCFSPGCNANSVSEYLVAGLLHLARKHSFTLEGKTIGVIGIGNVGKRVVKKAEALGMRVLQNDPPRERAENSSQFVSLEKIVQESDIITVHVPLTKDGIDATYHLADSKFFAKCKQDLIFIDAARGPVVDTPALISAIDGGKVSYCIMDTWEGEPDLIQELLDKVDIGTPHIAGHSYEGKVQGTIMVFEQACEFFGITSDWDPEPFMPEAIVPEISIDAKGRQDEEVLQEIISKIYDIKVDDSDLREISSKIGDDRKAHFDKLRKSYPMRREFRFTTITGKNMSQTLKDKISKLGFKI
ncbi:MAG: 4-phosphoerythronate dehydrogenase [Kiritimatiellae bacterium]|nr:4-phosphoerythronate dehydrogenase [Kiritimatiellia bacterium]